MGVHQSWQQPDLFGSLNTTQPREPMPAEFVERIRGELVATLAMARQADALPWRDLTAATLAELRFNSIAGWLPPDEANGLRQDFGREMIRLYEIADRAALAAE
jgi:hypothetical protein